MGNKQGQRSLKNTHKNVLGFGIEGQNSGTLLENKVCTINIKVIKLGNNKNCSCGGGRAYSAEMFKDYNSFETESEAWVPAGPTYCLWQQLIRITENENHQPPVRPG